MEPAPEQPPAPPRPRFRARVRARLERIFQRLVWLLGPIVASAVAWLACWAFLGIDHAWQILIVAIFSVTFLGTTVVFGEAVFGGGQVLPFTKGMTFDLLTWELALIAMWVASASGYFYAYNLDLLQRLPKIGPRLRRMRAEAMGTLGRRPWIRRLSTFGVAFFVMLPLPGSGSLGGCIVGHLLGVSRFASWVAVSLAGIGVSFAYAVAADKVKPMVDSVPVPWRIAGAVVVFGAVFLMVKFVTGGGGDDQEDADEAPSEPGRPARPTERTLTE